MRRFMVVMATLFVAAVSVPALAEAQVTGTWELSAEGPRGAQSMVLVLNVDGGDLTGTLTMQRMGGRGGGGGGRSGGAPEMTLNEGQLDGSSFSFTVTLSMRGNSIVQEFTGTVDGDAMSGTISSSGTLCVRSAASNFSRRARTCS